MKLMRKKAMRTLIIQEFIKNDTYDYRIRAIVGETLANPTKPVPLINIMRWLKIFLENTALVELVPN